MTDQEMEDLDSKLVVSIFFSQYSKRFFKTKTGTISCNSKISFTFYERNLALYYLLNYIGISINQIFNFFIQVFLSSEISDFASASSCESDIDCTSQEDRFVKAYIVWILTENIFLKAAMIFTRAEIIKKIKMLILWYLHKHIDLLFLV